MRSTCGSRSYNKLIIWKKNFRKLIFDDGQGTGSVSRLGGAPYKGVAIIFCWGGSDFKPQTDDR
jgi:hypothetical protein